MKLYYIFVFNLLYSSTFLGTSCWKQNQDAKTEAGHVVRPPSQIPRLTIELVAVACIGHVYAIGDCGGARQESRCPECKARIGGMSYRLTEGNRFAPEMDQATAPAWPGMAMN